MNVEHFATELVRARQRDLRTAADRHRLAESVPSDPSARPTLVGRVRSVTTLAWLARGARRDRRAVPLPPAAATTTGLHELCDVCGS